MADETAERGGCWPVAVPPEPSRPAPPISGEVPGGQPATPTGPTRPAPRISGEVPGGQPVPPAGPSRPAPPIVFFAAARDALATLVTKVILVPGTKTDDGVLVQAVAIPWLAIIEILQKDPSAMYRIPARKWEEIIAGAYRRAGFDEVTLTRRSGDHGRDVIAVKHGIGCVRFIDQVKAYAPRHLVTADEVRALIGVLSTDLGATKAVLTTTSDFAPRIPDDPSIKPLLPYRLELINGRTLVEHLTRLAGHPWAGGTP